MEFMSYLAQSGLTAYQADRVIQVAKELVENGVVTKQKGRLDSREMMFLNWLVKHTDNLQDLKVMKKINNRLIDQVENDF